MEQREQRHPTDMAIRVFHEDQAYRAGTVNLSASGACFTGIESLPIGAELVIRCAHLCIPAHVAWSTQQGTGVQFDKPLTPSDLRTLRGDAGDRAAGPDL